MSNRSSVFVAAVAAALLPSLGAFADSGVTFERYDGIGGSNVSDLTGSTAYQNHTPTSTTTLSSFEIPTNAADAYGSDVYGLFTPSVTGIYFFGIASDDASQLFLSTDATKANEVMIASITGWGTSRNYTAPEGGNSGNSLSGGISLTGGQSYFIEALQKEGGGGDNLAVTASLGTNTISNGQDPLGTGTAAPLGTLTVAPLPEPTMVGMAAAGLAALALRRRNRR